MNTQNVPNGQGYPRVEFPRRNGDIPQSSQNIIFDAVKKVTDLTFTVFNEAATVLLKGPRQGEYPTFQDHGVECKVCGRKRWCRVS